MRYMMPCHCLQASTTHTILTVYQLSSMLSFLPIYPDLQRMTWAGRGADLQPAVQLCVAKGMCSSFAAEAA